jgi:hypothetical protein
VQFPADTALAAAVTSDHRTFAIELLVDWGRTGLYDHAYSDLSVVTSDVNVPRDLQGDVPDEVNLVEGEQAAVMTAHLAGTRPGDPRTIGEILMPYRADSPMYGTLQLGVRVKYSITVGTDTGPVKIRQFTGRVRSVDVDSEGKVTILGQDHSELLRQAVNLRPWAMDSTRRQEDLPDHVQMIWTQWPLDHVLRQCRIYQSPPLVDTITAGDSVALFSATLHGGWNAEVGDTLQFDRAIDVRLNPMFIQGNTGLAANATPADFSAFDYFTPFAVPWPASWSVAMGCWLYCPQSMVSSPTDLIQVWMNNDNSKMYLRISNTGQLTANLTGTGGYNVTFTGPTVAGGAAWHYIGVSLRRLGGSGMEAKFTIDGVNTTATSATVYPDFGSTVIQQNFVRLQAAAPMQCTQIWVIKSGATLTWPKDVVTSANDLIPGSVLDQGWNGMTRIPDLYQVDAWDTLGDIAGAEYGLLWVDEFGTIRFADRNTVRTPATTQDRTVTLDHLTGYLIHNIADGVRNRYTYSVVQGVTNQDVSVFRAARVEDFDTPPESTTVYQVAVANAQYTGRKSMLIVSPWPDSDDWIQAGWYVFERGTANPAPGVTVDTYPINQKTIAVQITNPNTFWVRFSGNQNQPAMRIDGRQVTEELPRVGSVQHDGSISSYAERVFEIPDSGWRSYYESVKNIAGSLLNDTHTAIPTIDRVPCVGDPRTQLRDSVLIDTDRFGRMIGVVQGIDRTCSVESGLVEDLTIRLIHPPGSWLLGDPALSVLGSTTVLT